MEKLNIQFTQDDVAQVTDFNTIENKLEEVMQELRDLGYAKSKNLFDINATIDGKFYDSDGTLGTATNSFGEMFEIEPSTIYSLSIKNNYSSSFRRYVFIFDENMNRLKALGWGDRVASNTTYIRENYTVPANAKYITISQIDCPIANKNDVEIMFEKGSATPYVPYKDISYTKKTWVATDYLLYTYLNNIEDGLKNIGKVYFRPKGWQETKTWAGGMSFSYRDVNRWINNLNLIIDRLNTESNTLFPSDTLYPSETLLPH